MNETLNIAIVQAHLIWENPIQNRINFSNMLGAISKPVDLVILPEMFTSGFTMHADAVAETMQGETIKWMQTIAQDRNCALTGSLIIEEENNYYNRLVFVHPNGNIDSYNKRHTFTLAGENKVYKAGKEKVVLQYKGWKICPQVCYDLRFPVFARNTEDYDLLFYVANWPKPRIAAWDALLKARAIENMSYCVGVNRVGLDGKNHEYPGHSAVYDVLGEKLTHLEANKEGIEILQLSKGHIAKNRRYLGFLNDKDRFNLIM